MSMDFSVNVNVKTSGDEKIDTLEKKINSLKTESIKLKVDVDKSSLSKFRLNTNNSVKIKPTVDISGVKQVAKDFQMVKNLATQISHIKIKIAGLDTSKNANEILILQNQLKKLESDYKVLMKTFGSRFDKSQLGNLENIFGKANDKLVQINAKAKDLTKSMEAAIKPFSKLDAITASNKTLSWLKNNSKAAKDYGDTLNSLAEKQKNATNADELKQYTKEVNAIKSQASAEGKTGVSAFAELKRAGSQILQFTSIYGALQRIPQVIGNMASQVIKVDDAITNLRMATSISNDEALSLMSTYSKLGDELKATGVDVATSATEWLKQGKSIQESQKLAKDSIVLSKIGDLSSADATKTITAAMKSYNMTENEVMGFVDKISAIDLVSATDVGGLSQAFNEVAANAKNAGVEAEKLLSYAAVIGETSQEGMASVGTSLNAIFSRMGNIKLSRLKDYESGEDLKFWGIVA